MSPQKKRSRSVHAGLIDRLHAGTRSVAVLGPMAVPDVEQARARLADYAAHGPATRLGIAPHRGRGRWPYRPEALAAQVVSLPPAESPEALMAAGRSTEPFRLSYSGDYFLIEFDHGIGEVSAALTAVLVAGGHVDPRDPLLHKQISAVDDGLFAAAARTFLPNPAALLRVVRDARAGATRSVAEPADQPDALLVRGRGPAAQVAIIDADAVAALRRAPRDGDRVSVKTLVMCGLVNALTEAGIDLDEQVTLPVDLRRYLRRGVNPLSNMVAGVPFPVRPGTDPADVQRSIGAAVVSGRPVAGAVRSSLTAAAALLSGRLDTDPETPLPAGRARLLYSGVHGSPQFQLFDWHDPATVRAQCRSDPGGPRDITVTSLEVHGRITLTASYWPDHQDGDVICAALQRYARDPLVFVS